VHSALGYDVGRMTVIPNGFDFNQFRHDANARVALRSEWAIDDDMPLIGTVGRFDPQKDHRNLLRACEILRGRGVRFRLALVGHELVDANVMLSGGLKATACATASFCSASGRTFLQ
jgi:glycosyltransferase involved in cell wall biosynthesis